MPSLISFLAEAWFHICHELSVNKQDLLLGSVMIVEKYFCSVVCWVNRTLGGFQ